MIESSILEAFKSIEEEDFFMKAKIFAASGHNTVECLLLETKEVQTLINAPQKALPLLEIRMKDQDISDQVKIVCVVTLAKFGSLQAAKILIEFIESLPDEIGEEANHITHPYGYAVRALRRITKDEELFEVSQSQITQRLRIIQHVQDWLEKKEKN
ncbi:hypothetical protein KKE26_06525 [bacterium]|nr:hypothetical protein [bacterium]MBU1752856.1 hypothetical protein [bacterium]